MKGIYDLVVSARQLAISYSYGIVSGRKELLCPRTAGLSLSPAKPSSHSHLIYQLPCHMLHQLLCKPSFTSHTSTANQFHNHQSRCPSSLMSGSKYACSAKNMTCSFIMSSLVCVDSMFLRISWFNMVLFSNIP